MSEARPARTPRPVGRYLAFVAVILLALNLRPGAASPGPLLEEIVAAYGAGKDTGGLITAVPGLCFAVVGILAVPIGRRFGLSGALLLAAIVTTIGLALRPVMPTMPLFLVLSLLALAGPAIGNVLLPAWVKRHGGRHTVALMTVYGVCLATGGALGSLLSVPVADAAPGTWRTALAFWGVLALLAAIAWLAVQRRARYDFPPRPSAGQLPGSILRSPTAIALTLVFGLQSMGAYIQMGWIPQIYRDAGVNAALAGALAAVIGALGVLGGLLMPTVVARTRHLQAILLGFGLLTAAGYLGLLLAPAAAPALWVVMLGVGGWVFPTSLALIPARTRDPLVTARLSAMVQPLGYLMAAAGPFLVGLMRESFGGWQEVIVGLIAAALVMGVIGWRAAADRVVDDELHGRM
ncbi:MAG: MFS transporter [Brachybacterium sp.]|nr:MFS transporter [Brachybacterium sp.]